MSEVAKEVDSVLSPNKKARIENKEGHDGDLSSLKHNGNTDFEDVQDGVSTSSVDNEEEWDEDHVKARYEREQRNASERNELSVHLIRAIKSFRLAAKSLYLEIAKRLKDPYFANFTLTDVTTEFLSKLKKLGRKEPLLDDYNYLQDDLINWQSEAIVSNEHGFLLFHLLDLDRDNTDPLHVAREQDVFIFNEVEKIVPFEQNEMVAVVRATANELAQLRQSINDLIARPSFGVAASIEQGAARQGFFNTPSCGSTLLDALCDHYGS